MMQSHSRLLFITCCLILSARGVAQPEKPALIPAPQQLEWKGDYFSLRNGNAIIYEQDSVLTLATRLQELLDKSGWHFATSPTGDKREGNVILRIAKVKGGREAYLLEVSKRRILLQANTLHGLFNGTQTLRQLIEGKERIPGCSITDWPAFSWRGYMVDVGRNFQPMQMLKQQIDIMARYKLNIFQLHFTEDIAWRWEVKNYPQLTAPGNMVRNKGEYYTDRQLRELISYCNDRYITLVPEIDMPGHSAAFKRAIGADMQSDTGMRVMRELLTTFCNTFEVPYLHIGGDEVKITNKAFLPEMIALVQRMGKQTIGWDPGGNLDDKTIRQLWMKDGVVNKHWRYIDSRHLYLNHMDPLESVVTVFHRRIGDREKADSNMLGGVICLWNDRKVAQPADVLRMNPVYPAMLAFAERSWRGGGSPGWITNVRANDKQEVTVFADFENRLWIHRQLYFQQLPFPYTPQSKMRWQLYGPYENKGILSATFAPEVAGFHFDSKTAPETMGGTLILRHFWHPLVKGVLEEAIENTTWYAHTRIWSDRDTTRLCWISGSNLSRSYNSDTPAAGEWDNRDSKIWVNDSLIPAPVLMHAGQKGDAEIPLVDEGYEYRSPAKVFLKQGWNKVVIKLPVGNFKGTDWQNPVKWMFTFVPLTLLP